jgi:putative ABC transport system substrate-binding protein
MHFNQLRRREFITLLGGAAVAWPLAARAQQGGKLPRLGILSPGRSELPEPGVIMLDAFVQGLHELGYAEGRNLILERRYAEWRPERLRELAAELAGAGVDVIVAFATPAARAAKQATSAIPIVAVAVGDPVADGLVDSLAKPGGNVTGTSFLGPELTARRLQLFSRISFPGSRMWRRFGTRMPTAIAPWQHYCRTRGPPPRR